MGLWRRSCGTGSTEADADARVLLLGAPVRRTQTGLCDLPELLVSHCLGFQLGLEDLTHLVPVSRVLKQACREPRAWASLVIVVPVWALEHPQLVHLALDSWQDCTCVRLSAGPKRSAVAAALSAAGFRPPVEVADRGPLMLFSMRIWENVVPGQQMQLHFFEPRYRWMCARLIGPPPHARTEANRDHDSTDDDIQQAGSQRIDQSAPRALPTFGFVTKPRNSEGSTGVLAEIKSHSWNMDGTCDVLFTVIEHFVTLEVFEEEVPNNRRAPKLQVAYFTTPGKAQNQPAKCQAVQRRAGWQRRVSLQVLYHVIACFAHIVACLRSMVGQRRQ